MKEDKSLIWLIFDTLCRRPVILTLLKMSMFIAFLIFSFVVILNTPAPAGFNCTSREVCDVFGCYTVTNCN